MRNQLLSLYFIQLNMTGMRHAIAKGGSLLPFTEEARLWIWVSRSGISRGSLGKETGYFPWILLRVSFRQTSIFCFRKKKKKKKKKHLQDRNKWVSNTKMGNAKQVVRTRSEWKQTTWMGFTLAGFCWECLSSRKIREGWMWITSLQNTKNVTILSIKLSNFKRRWTSNMNILFNFNLYTPFLSRTKLISNQLIKALRKI